MNSMKGIFKKKKDSLSLSNLSEIMYLYNCGNLAQDKQFIYFVEKEALGMVTVKDEFNTLNATKLLWGLAKFSNRSICPYYSSEIGGSIINRAVLSKTPSVNHRI